MTMIRDRPTTVPEFVIPIVVDAIDSVFPAGSFAHRGNVPANLTNETKRIETKLGIEGLNDVWKTGEPTLTRRTWKMVGVGFTCHRLQLWAWAIGAIKQSRWVSFGLIGKGWGRAFVFCLGVRKTNDDQTTKTFSIDGGGHVGFL